MNKNVAWKELRNKHGYLSDKSFIADLGISKGDFYNNLSGRHMPTPQRIYRMSTLLECALEDLFMVFNDAKEQYKSLNQ